MTNRTSHVVAKKRNTPAGLQALVQGRWIVTEAFVDALATATQQRPDVEDGRSLLEEDFDKHWPKEEDFIVSSGTEPVPRPDSFLKPKTERAEIFQSFTFIFLAQGQYDNLMPVITAGGGKALLFEVLPNETPVQDVVDYLKEVAGKKGIGPFKLSQQSGRGGVVVVRLQRADEGWTKRFLEETDYALDQRSIEQSEFLDAILTVEPSGLRKQLEEEPESSMPNGTGGAPPSPSSSPPQRQQQEQRQERNAITVPDSPPADPPRAQLQADEASAQPLPATGRRRARRLVTESRFKGFEDVDPSHFTRPASSSPEPSLQDREPSQAPSASAMEVDEPNHARSVQQGSRKRPAPVPEEPEENEEDMMDSLLTGAAAMKRRRMEARQTGENAVFNKSFNAERDTGVDKAKPKKKKAKEVDVRAAVQERRDREDEERRKDEEALRNAMEGVDISEMKNLAKVEEMEIPVRVPQRPSAAEDGRSDRWDDKWNGRRNFKKFRPKGSSRTVPRLQRVMVPLEECPRKGHGIGEDYWITPSTSSSKNKSQKTQSQSQSQTQAVRQAQHPSSDDTGEAARFRRRIHSSREQDALDDEAEEVRPEEIAGTARDAGIERAVHATPDRRPGGSTQTLAASSQRKSAGKRPAGEALGAAAKRVKQTKSVPSSREIVELDEEDDDDGLKFRRRRR